MSRFAHRLGLWLVLVLATLGAAASPQVEVYAFVAEGCAHCEHAVAFLAREAAAHTDVRLHRLEVTRVPENRRRLGEIAARLGHDPSFVPFVVIGERVIVGYLDDARTGSEYRRAIEAARGAPARAARAPERIRLPLVGEVSLLGLSLPILTVLLAAVDGFNPCAMWTLVFLIGLLLGMKDRARMWALGGAFIAGSAAVYFLFMAAWLNLLLFLGSVAWVRAGIALVAVGGGLYYLREFATNPQAACKVTAPEGRQRVFRRLRALATERNFLLALGGILVLAFAVNLVEAVCSAGIPAVYAQVLAANALATWQYYAFILLYVAIFMLDDLLVFAAAMKTLEFAGIGTRFTRASNLVGGVLLLALGAVMLLRPQWLMF